MKKNREISSKLKSHDKHCVPSARISFSLKFIHSALSRSQRRGLAVPSLFCCSQSRLSADCGVLSSSQSIPLSWFKDSLLRLKAILTDSVGRFWTFEISCRRSGQCTPFRKVPASWSRKQGEVWFRAYCGTAVRCGQIIWRARAKCCAIDFYLDDFLVVVIVSCRFWHPVIDSSNFVFRPQVFRKTMKSLNWCGTWARRTVVVTVILAMSLGE